MSTGHCAKHCTRPPGHEWGKCVGVLGEQWHRKCPRCAEAERIVAAIEGAAEAAAIGMQTPEDTVRWSGILDALAIVRGET